jgi:hypothetical protein
MTSPQEVSRPNNFLWLFSVPVFFSWNPANIHLFISASSNIGPLYWANSLKAARFPFLIEQFSWPTIDLHCLKKVFWFQISLRVTVRVSQLWEVDFYVHRIQYLFRPIFQVFLNCFYRVPRSLGKKEERGCHLWCCIKDCTFFSIFCLTNPAQEDALGASGQ